MLEDIGDRMAIRKDTVSMSDILQKGPQRKPGGVIYTTFGLASATQDRPEPVLLMRTTEVNIKAQRDPVPIFTALT